MSDVVAPKPPSLILGLVEVTLFLNLNMSLIPKNLANVEESPIWSTLIPSHLVLPDDVDVSDDNEKEDDHDDDDDDLSPMPIESEGANSTC